MSEEPTFKTFTFQVMDQQPEAEIISLISQVMEAYSDLPTYKRFAIAEWFLEQFGRGRKQSHP